MKKLSIKLIVSLSSLLLISTPVVANASELYGNTGIESNEAYRVSEEDSYIEVMNDNGELLVFYREGNNFFIKYPNGISEIWATRTLESSTQENNNSLSAISPYSSSWKYYTTDKYSTRINWKVIDAGLSLAEQARILNNTLGFLIGAGSLLLSIRPNTVYHIDYIYTYVYDPMYWKANVNIYRYSNYTSLLDAYTKTWYINQ